MKKAKRKFSEKMWGGFIDSRLDVRGITNHNYEHFDQATGAFIRRAVSAAIFSNRREARRQYQDVRRVTITGEP